MTAPHIPLPQVEVTLDDGRVETVQLLNADFLQWDKTASANKWPPMDKVGAWHNTFVTWAALRRTGKIPTDDKDTWGWEAFSEFRALSVKVINADANGVVTDAVDPTPQEAEAD